MALDDLRAEIDRADQELSAAFARRMEIATRAWPPTWSGCTARCLP